MNEIQMTFYSLLNLFDKKLWFKVLSELEKIINQKLTHLDINDPVKKRVLDLNSAADFICAVRQQESSRKIFGKFGKSKIEFSISIYKETSFFPNSFSIYFPFDISDEKLSLSMLRRSFAEINRCLSPFYSLCDSLDKVASKRKATGYAVDLQAELIGAFWLTYLNKTYVDYFKESKFHSLPCSKIKGLNGYIIDLGESPYAVTMNRENVEALLGKGSFVDPALGYDKPVGQNALRFDELS